MQFAFFIQARLGSSRLPRKILLPFYQGETILDLLIKKLLHIHANVVLATSIDLKNKELVHPAGHIQSKSHNEF